MDWNAEHLAYVGLSYGLVATVLAACVIYTLWQAKMLKARLHALNLSDVGAHEPK